MGRRRIYFSEEDRKKANCKKAEKYYKNNREKICERNLKKYHQDKLKPKLEDDEI